MWLIFGRDPKFAKTVEFYPPDGMSPAELGYVVDGALDHKDMNALHRVSVFASQTLDTLPTNPGYIIATGICEVPIHDSYKYVFISTVLNTTITALLVATILTIFPGLA